MIFRATCNPATTNNFDYSVDGVPGLTNRFCPFFSHTRKTAPRNLDPYIDRKFLESALIARAAIPYGPELPANGSEDSTPRGLLFVCYQSSLDQGFVQQTVGFAANEFFPITGLKPQRIGLDPIISGPAPLHKASLDIDSQPISGEGTVEIEIAQKDGSKYVINGPATKVDTSLDAFTPDYFVTSRGGEYFFVPSVSALKLWSKLPQRSELDIMFLLDATGSQQPYINQVRDSVTNIYDKLLQSGSWSKDDIRIGITAFRDHPPQDNTFVTRSYPFTTDMSKIVESLNDLQAVGGGDFPEAQCDALADALKADWEDEALKITILITDSPPHGVGEVSDKLSGGCPIQNDPLQIVDQMSRVPITLYVLACEPTLSTQSGVALDFYTGLVQKTGGQLLPLGNASNDTLVKLVQGLIHETVSAEKLVGTYSAFIASRQGQDQHKIAQELCNHMTSSGDKAHCLRSEEYYTFPSTAINNANVWAKATKLDDATRKQIKKVTGFRVVKKFRDGSTTPVITSEELPVDLTKAHQVVMKALRRM